MSQRGVRADGWARQHARSLGKDLGQAEARLLCNTVGTELAVVEREVEKLALYAGDEPRITREHVEQCCALLAEADIWALTNAIAAGDVNATLVALHRQLEQGQAPHRLLANVAFQLRRMVRAQEMVRAGASDNAIGQATRVRGRTLAALRKDGGSDPHLTHALERIARANRDMNSHRAGDRRVFEALVLELAGG